MDATRKIPSFMTATQTLLLPSPPSKKKKNLQRKQIWEDETKAKETPTGAQMHYSSVRKQGKRHLNNIKLRQVISVETPQVLRSESNTPANTPHYAKTLDLQRPYTYL